MMLLMNILYGLSSSPGSNVKKHVCEMYFWQFWHCMEIRLYSSSLAFSFNNDILKHKFVALPGKQSIHSTFLYLTSCFALTHRCPTSGTLDP